MSRRPGKQRQAGFSLIELLAVMAIALVLLAAGAPDLRQVIRTQQLKAATADLFAAIGLARAQALARGETVTLLPKGAGGADWRRGWTVFLARRHHPGRARSAGAGHCRRLFLHHPGAAFLYRLQWRRAQLPRQQSRGGALWHAVAVPWQRHPPY
jgi:prepilin-type N-terminal cleavage/methylation domain-containing protein